MDIKVTITLDERTAKLGEDFIAAYNARTAATVARTAAVSKLVDEPIVGGDWTDNTDHREPVQATENKPENKPVEPAKAKAEEVPAKAKEKPVQTEIVPTQAQGEPTYAIEEVRQILAEKKREIGDAHPIKDIISSYGVKTVADLDPKDYGALVERVKALRAE